MKRTNERTRGAALAIAAAMALVAAPASAAPSVGDKATAEALFDEARALMKDGKAAEACPKLAESQRIDPGVGTLMYLASCYEKTTRAASAWATFREAAAAARAAAQPDREKVALARADALEANLPRMTVKSLGNEEGLVVRRDGVVIGSALFGSRIPVDAGEHVLEATAPGRRDWKLAMLAESGKTIEVVIPTLEAVASTVAASEPPVREEPAAPPKPAVTRFWGTQRVVGAGASGLGVAALGIGVVFGLRTISTWSDVETMCPSDRCASGDGKTLADSARGYGNISTAGFIAAAALIGGGAFLFFTAPKATSTTAIRLAPSVSAGGAGLTLGGAL